MDQPVADRFSRRSTVATTSLVLVLALVPVLRLAGQVRVQDLTDGLNRSNELVGQIDPNAAPWWELSHLPGIGETRARQIVEYRELVRARRGSPSSIVFHGPADMTKVEGIGATIAERIAPRLAFPP